MPHVILSTNVVLPDEKAAVLQLGEASSRILGKPLQAFLIQYKHDPTLAFAGTFDPAWMLQVYALGIINEEANEAFTKGYWEFAQSLGLPADRGYITFFDPGWENWAAKGQTLAFRDPKKQKA
ncbi:Tautomerase/MIF [Calocera viscosa TUFC12733]|uniref:L-dopachrome isomerase n=1 Tax=Calocera viscosa (strain TUFC12733) TaxID=1330018 RepID=A0A167KXP0_CALVF|nr:Tautomerase/MIF [Calocera viscosa TUFC12733]